MAGRWGRRISLAGRVSTALLALSWAGFVADVAQAQLAARESVLGRPRPDFESYGLSLDMLTSPDDRSRAARFGGSFDLFAKAILDVGHDSNVRRTKDDAVSSVFERLQGSLALRSDWTNHEARLVLDIDDMRYADASGETVTDVAAKGSVRLDLDDGVAARFDAGAKRGHVARGDDADPGPAFGPLKFADYKAAAFYDDRRSDRLFYRLAGDAIYRDYFSTDGTKRDNLDRTTLSGRGLVGVTYGGMIDLFVSPAVNRVNFSEQSSSAQDSTRFDLSLGWLWDQTGVASVGGKVGGSHRRFDQSGRAAQNDMLLGLDMLWNLTPVLSLTAAAEVENQQSDAANTGTKLARAGKLRLDYDPFERVILSGFASFSDEDFQEIDRRDEELRYGLEARYLLNEYAFVGLRLEQHNSDSTNKDYDFEATTVSFRLGAKLCCMTDQGPVNPFD